MRPFTDRRVRVALAIGACIALLALLFRATVPRGSRANSVTASTASEIRSEDVQARPLNEPTAPIRQHRTPVGAMKHEPASVASEVDPLLQQLRSMASARDFHTRAWPVMGAITQLAGSDGSAVERLVSVAHGAESDVERVRAASLVALGEGGFDASRSVAEEFLLAPSAELERAGWIVIGLLSTGSKGLRVAVDDLRGPGERVTFPAIFERESAEDVIERAITRLQRAVPVELMEVHDHSDQNRPRLEEQFTRSVVVLAVLGPAAGHAGPVRTTLLRWLRGVAPLALLADDAVLHCLSLAAKDDVALAAELLDVAASRLFEPEGTAILEALVRLGGRDELVLDHLRGFFASEEAIEGDPLHALTQVQAVAALMPLLVAEDPALRREAAQLVIERLIDPKLDPTERLLFLTTLATSRSDLVLEAVNSLVDQDASDELVQDAVSFLDAVPPEQREASEDFLVSLLGRQGLDSSTRLAIIQELAQLGSNDLLLSLRMTETDPATLKLLNGFIADR